jgi:hypothetical protein
MERLGPYQIHFDKMCNQSLEEIAEFTVKRLKYKNVGPEYCIDRYQKPDTDYYLEWAIGFAINNYKNNVLEGIIKGMLMHADDGIEYNTGIIHEQPDFSYLNIIRPIVIENPNNLRAEIRSELKKYFIPEDSRIEKLSEHSHYQIQNLFAESMDLDSRTDDELLPYWEKIQEDDPNKISTIAILNMTKISNKWWDLFNDYLILPSFLDYMNKVDEVMEKGFVDNEEKFSEENNYLHVNKWRVGAMIKRGTLTPENIQERIEHLSNKEDLSDDNKKQLNALNKII